MDKCSVAHIVKLNAYPQLCSKFDGTVIISHIIGVIPLWLEVILLHICIFLRMVRSKKLHQTHLLFEPQVTCISNFKPLLWLVCKQRISKVLDFHICFIGKSQIVHRWCNLQIFSSDFTSGVLFDCSPMIAYMKIKDFGGPLFAN